MKGKSECAVPGIVHVANYPGTASAALPDDSMMKTISKMGALQGSQNQVGTTEPKYFLIPEPTQCHGCDSNVSVLMVSFGFSVSSGVLLRIGLLIRSSVQY